MNGGHVVFGKVIDGLNMLAEMERVGSRNGQTRVPITIVDCGELPADDDANQPKL